MVNTALSLREQIDRSRSAARPVFGRRGGLWRRFPLTTQARLLGRKVSKAGATGNWPVLAQPLCRRVNDYQKATSAVLSRFHARSLGGKPKRSQFAFSSNARTQMPASPRCWKSGFAAGVCTSRNRLVPPTMGSARSARIASSFCTALSSRARVRSIQTASASACAPTAIAGPEIAHGPSAAAIRRADRRRGERKAKPQAGQPEEFAERAQDDDVAFGHIGREAHVPAARHP